LIATKLKALLGAAALLTVATGSVRAETIGLTYIGQVTPGAQANYGVSGVSGSGIVTFADGLTSVTAADLSDFSFTLTVAGGSGTDIDTYGIGDLNAFTAALDSAGDVTALSFTTDFGSGSWYYPSQQLSMVLNGDSSTGNFDTGEFAVGTLTTTASVPEPATLTLMAGGLLGLARIRRKRG
jgi:hypothetical protein